ncbi:hypothetical protein J6590_081619 [Homalodisca vitripennis]|nr:hypothetical protein J6590_081619 [Homalodisca vitripennis]
MMLVWKRASSYCSYIENLKHRIRAAIESVNIEEVSQSNYGRRSSSLGRLQGDSMMLVWKRASSYCSYIENLKHRIRAAIESVNIEEVSQSNYGRRSSSLGRLQGDSMMLMLSSHKLISACAMKPRHWREAAVRDYMTQPDDRCGL